jgi:two-component system CheB/CheR fusion protein
MQKLKKRSAKKKIVPQKTTRAGVKKSSVKLTNGSARKKEKHFPVVAIGASLGGLKAFSLLLKYLPANTGMAYIYVQHLDRDHKSILTSILAKLTKMKVQEVEDMEHMEPDNLYVIPNDKEIKVTNGHIQLLPRPKNKAGNVTVDVLFSSLALTHKKNVVGIILSGNGRDGAEGLTAIKEAGGITIAQDQSAQASSMPQSVIDMGIVDFVLSPRGIAHELVRFSKSGFVRPDPQEGGIADNDPDLKVIFAILHKTVSVDFTRYKLNTLKRRINHRMMQAGVESIKEYTRLLLKQSGEVELLYKDLLINVTSFFRDPEIFRYLKSTFLPKLLKRKLPAETLRIWVPACSTGEEAYSIAMLITELQENKSRRVPIQIFATDLSDHAIRDARKGEYSQGEVNAVTKSRVKRFFTKTGETYHINKEIREMCVFATHNILRDPPFFRIDFISCCNLLIYFDAAAQKKVLSTMHFALSDKGYLMLGKSETTGTSSILFTQVNSKFKLYSCKKNTGPQKTPDLAPRVSGTTIPKKNLRVPSKKNTPEHSNTLDSAIDSALLSGYMPACAIINKDMEILQFRGSTGLYLAHPSGKASLNILKMMRPEFAFELRNAIQHVLKTKQPICKSGIEMNTGVVGTSFQLMSLDVSLLKIEWDEPLLLIVFSLQEKVEKYIENDKGGKNNSTQKDLRIKKLMLELHSASLEMHSVIESQEKAYEELQVANEEIVSTNEEFQTLNEELETSKEEIEATNEELISTNHELKLQNDLLAESYAYSQTIIATIHEPMIVLDRNLHVKSANNSFYKKFQVTKEATEGVLLFELGNKQWEIPKLHGLLEALLRKNTSFENFEVTHFFPHLGEKVMLLNASRIIQKTHGEKLILLAIKDITERATHQNKVNSDFETNLRLYRQGKVTLEKAVRRRTQQLEQKNIELERANNDLVTFTYVSSHDLQEPLRKIQNIAEYILEKEHGNLSDDGQEQFQRMQATAKRMQSLIEDLLAYSRAKNPERNFVKTDLNTLIAEIKIDMEDTIKKQKAKVSIARLPDLKVLPSQFRQLMCNLIGNSLKFSKPGIPPVITIKSKTSTGHKLNAENALLAPGSLLPRTKYCRITLRDNGIGFDPQYKERIFEVFQRLHSYEQYKGTGIGLAICKRIVENHNGVITATGELNKGVQFDIYIPE